MKPPGFFALAFVFALLVQSAVAQTFSVTDIGLLGSAVAEQSTHHIP